MEVKCLSVSSHLQIVQVIILSSYNGKEFASHRGYALLARKQRTSHRWTTFPQSLDFVLYFLPKSLPKKFKSKAIDA